MSSQTGSADQPHSQPIVVHEQPSERTSIRSRDARGR
jgi:hypothetical protein